jgi:uncharacterized protein YbaR (Trm112 family)
MKTELMVILVCPHCNGELELEVLEEEEGEVVTGSLHCVACNLSYPICDGVPNLLLPESRSNI